MKENHSQLDELLQSFRPDGMAIRSIAQSVLTTLQEAVAFFSDIPQTQTIQKLLQDRQRGKQLSDNLRDFVKASSELLLSAERFAIHCEFVTAGDSTLYSLLRQLNADLQAKSCDYLAKFARTVPPETWPAVQRELIEGSFCQDCAPAVPSRLPRVVAIRKLLGDLKATKSADQAYELITTLDSIKDEVNGFVRELLALDDIAVSIYLGGTSKEAFRQSYRGAWEKVVGSSQWATSAREFARIVDQAMAAVEALVREQVGAQPCPTSAGGWRATLRRQRPTTPAPLYAAALSPPSG
jgi:hypothetical protein